MTVTALRDVATVESFIAGRWSGPTGETTTLLDAATSEPVARIGTGAPDAAGAAEHARRVGGPALRSMTFHERALVLKQLAQHLNGCKDAFYDLSARTGATRRDSLVDVDGGIGVLFTYGSKGRRELPGGSVYLDGPTEALGRGGQFVGQHVYTSRHGVAVQINAFNFPVWGMLEKFAPAFLAGVPTIAKPASQTAYLTEFVVREALDSGLLPEGSLQLLAGSARGVLDVLGDQDLVAFTGSASTANSLRSHRSVLEGGVRFTSEADSLNFSLLGPDAVPGTAEFDLFVRQLVTEMTAKAGQKCTAIRRALVPDALLGDVAEAVRERIAQKVTVGHPQAEGVTMGALVSLAQREEVRARVAELQRGARIVAGDPGHVETVGADAERGAFLSPLLLLAEDAGRAEVHEVEAFGPVSTLIGYGSTAQAVELAARGRGSLVGSVVSNDPDVVRDVVLGVAPWHGRVLVLDRDSAKESTGHGSPLPHLTHGGPGRAGDGEELGGIRGVLHFMQRSALQGSPRALSAVTGTWMPGAPRTTPDTHPFQRSLAELRVGDSVEAGPRTITLEDIDHFAEFSGDRFYAHTDEEAAAANPFFEGRVAHGYFLVSLAAGLFVQPDPGPVLANYGLENLRFTAPVYPGDEVRVQLTAKSIAPRVDADYGEVRWDAQLFNQRDETVATYDVLTLVAKTR
ncbi:phenylacetic acid degradation bifunctional protein PaaZ [Kineococcus auxinigenes]|uniref:phenylacetic acid degradation bifunctional protein PaaZ n=1 Tax=unclassified Kineococcus TaxID=2621656 RepID=UPI003D7CF77C